MKSMDIQQFVEEVYRQAESKRDFLADTRETRMITVDNTPYLKIGRSDPQEWPINKTAHRQIGSFLNIPAAYYDRCLETDPGFLEETVNFWLEHTEPRTRMVRTLDNRVRAYLSNRYHRIDNIDVMKSITESIRGSGFSAVSANISDEFMYLKFSNPTSRRDVKPDDPIDFGFIVSNSEIGMGTFQIRPFFYRLICFNGMIVEDESFKRRHSGVELSTEGVLNMEYLQDDTLKAMDEALMKQVRDLVAYYASKEFIDSMIERLHATTERKVEEPIHAVEELKKRFSLTDDEKEGILNAFIQNGDTSQWGLANAITRYAQGADTYDRGVELEQIGGVVVQLRGEAWSTLAKAA